MRRYFFPFDDEKKIINYFYLTSAKKNKKYFEYYERI